MHRPKVFLIDAHSFCYRAFFAIRGLTNSSGQPTGAIYGFINILNKIIKENQPDYLGVCFDVNKKTFRSEKFKEYKINRTPMPDDLVSQMPIIKDVVSAYKYKIYEKEGYEADDVIATIADKLSADNKMDIFIVSADKDIMQLLKKNVKIYNPYKEDAILDEDKLNESLGITPGKIVDMLALMGDNADNIPGVPGIGEKTALKLIKEFDSVSDLIRNIEKIESDKLKESILKYKDQLNLSRDLAELERNVPIDIELNEMKMDEPDKGKLFTLFRELEFKHLLKNLTEDSDELKVAEQKEETRDSDIRSFFKDILGFSMLIEAENIGSVSAKIKGIEIFKEGNKSIYCRNLNLLREVLANEKISKITYDLKAVKLLLQRENIELKGKCFDVMLAAYVLDPGKADYSLKNLSVDYLNELNSDSAKLVFDLSKVLERKLEEHNLANLFFNIEVPLASVLASMEVHGVSLDLKLLAGLSMDLDKKISILIKEIYAAVGTEFNINSPKQIREILFDKLKLKPVKRTKTGASTDEESLSKLLDKHPSIPYLLQYRELSKLKSTYVDALPQLINQETGRIHASFNQMKTSTGRLSSSNPNLQNIPIRTEIGASIRKAFVPTDRSDLLLSADYSQIELRILAHISGDKALREAFKKDADIHRFTASLIFDVSEDKVDDKMRDTAKRINFGIIYGMSVYGLAKDLEIQPAESQNFIDAYFLRYPKVKEYMEKIVEEAKNKGYVTTLLGRRRYLPQINGKNKVLQQFAARAAINAPIQGSAADMIKMAMIEIDKKLRERKLSAAMILQVHDELVFEVSEKDLEEVAKLVKKGMEQILDLDVPIKVDLKQGKNWLEMGGVGI